MTSDSVIAALRAALEVNPNDVDVRLHLADLLVQAESYDEAEDHYHTVLKADPTNIKALQGASVVARALGEDAKAQGYEKLLSALESSISGNTTVQADNIKPFPITPKTQDATRNVDQPEKTVRLRTVETSDNVTVGPWEEVEPPVTLADVGGMEEVKKRLNIAFLAPMKNPELMKMYGKSLKGGMMLYGPPGCGKTFIARALAGELGAKFMTIGLSDVLDMWLGESERKLHEIFEAARRNAPTVVFFDEIDALGQKRSQLRHSAGRNIVNQLLAEMDSVGSDNKNVFILAATNHPWDVDTALRRPGRFDRVVLVLPPDATARLHILQHHLKDRPVENIDLQSIAARTELFSGADIAHLCESAVEYALEESLTTGTTRPVISADFDKALKEIRPSTRPWFETARNYAMFANEGGVYDDLLNYIRAQKL